MRREYTDRLDGIRPNALKYIQLEDRRETQIMHFINRYHRGNKRLSAKNLARRGKYMHYKTSGHPEANEEGAAILQKEAGDHDV